MFIIVIKQEFKNQIQTRYITTDQLKTTANKKHPSMMELEIDGNDVNILDLDGDVNISIYTATGMKLNEIAYTDNTSSELPETIHFSPDDPYLDKPFKGKDQPFPEPLKYIETLQETLNSCLLSRWDEPHAFFRGSYSLDVPMLRKIVASVFIEGVDRTSQHLTTAKCLLANVTKLIDVLQDIKEGKRECHLILSDGHWINPDIHARVKFPPWLTHNLGTLIKLEQDKLSAITSDKLNGISVYMADKEFIKRASLSDRDRIFYGGMWFIDKTSSFNDNTFKAIIDEHQKVVMADNDKILTQLIELDEIKTNLKSYINND